MLNLKNTLDGYLKNVEVIGNTIQDTNNLANIRSVGDKVEGQELYKIPVVSCGKNLNSGLEVGTISNSGVLENNDLHMRSKEFIQLYSNNLSVSTYGNGYIVILQYDKDKKFIEFFNVGVGNRNNITLNQNVKYIKFRYEGTDSPNIQIEYGSKISSFEPYKGDKLEILSPVQLEKVGNVADRIICKDGVWGIEKHIGHYTFVGNEITMSQGVIGSTNLLYWSKCNTTLKNKPSTRYLLCNVQKYGMCGTSNKEGLHHICFNIDGSNMLFDTDKDISGANNYLKGNYINYILAEPQFIPLPYDQQVKLRTFAGQTNIAFLTEIPGQIKAQVPKSLGATVNTHTEQIADLHNSLDRVKKLEETTVSTVETGSSFTTVDATSNGYFEDVKLEGKTLVNLIKDGNIQKNLGKGNTTLAKYSYNRILDVDKTYTFICKVSNVEEKGDNRPAISFNSGVNGSGIRIDNGMNIFTFKNNVSLTSDNQLWIFYSNSSPVTSTNPCIDYVLILEGDHTNNPPGYYKGLMSVGQDVEEVSVESVNKNLFDGDVYYEVDSRRCFHVQQISNLMDITISYDAEIKGSGTGKMWAFLSNTYVEDVLNHDTLYQRVVANGNGVEYSFLNSQIIKNTKNYKYIYLTSGVANGNGVVYKNIQLERNSSKTDYIRHKSNKKPLLYYNPTTETWEKPVLREWDTIEKHSDGKYYYHKRSGEVVLNGNEDWYKSSTANYFWTMSVLGNRINSELINDRFPVIANGWNGEVDCISPHTTNKYIYINKRNIGTVSEFKQWLKDNPTTVVYQLEQEEVYECTNIDLMTYSGETNYIINSGAISPKSLLKVHNNISNVVKILQEKVSLLENTFIAGLRSVLSGDMYSLATILYPEDFEQNDNTEQDIMVIPE